MSFTIVQRFGAASTGLVNSQGATSGSSVTAGNLLVAVFSAFNGAPLPSGVNCTIDDSGSNLWQGANSNGVTVVFPATPDQLTFNLWFSVITTGGTLTVTISPSLTSYLSLDVYEISGAGQTFSLSQPGVGVGGNGGTPNCGNVLVSGSDIVFGAFGQLNVASTSWTPGAGYTAGLNTQIGSNPIGYLVEYLANTSTNPATPTATLAGGANLWAAAGFALTTTPSTITSAYVTKSGTLGMFGVALNYAKSNGAYPLASVTAVNSNPTIKVNGNTVSIGPATWTETDKNTPIVAYLLKCGGVRSIPMSSGGAGYTSPSASASGGGGTGLTLGTPNLGVGVTSYTITSAGSGLTNGSFQWTVPGGTFTSTFSSPANAYITISGGVVTSVVPYVGPPFGTGAAYDPTVTSFTAAYGNATITCNVSHYVLNVPVTASGSGYTSPPTITISDSTGTGATPAPIMTGPASTDTITYSASLGWLTTNAGPANPATNAAMANFVGVNEGPNGNFSGFTAAPKVQIGGEMYLTSTSSQTGNLYFGKNRLKSADKWTAGAGTSSFTLDSNYFPVSWTPGGILKCQFFADADGLMAIQTGTWHVVYDDEYYATPSRAPGPTTVALTEGAQWNLTLTNTTRSGTTITLTYTTSITFNSVRATFSDMEFTVTAPSDGLWHLKDQSGVSNPWVFGPGNTPDRSKPFAMDDQVVARLTNNGTTIPACIRFMDILGAAGGQQNNVIAASIVPTTLFSYAVPYAATVSTGTPAGPPFSAGNPLPSGNGSFQFARFYNTNPSSTTYSWSSPRLYSTSVWANSGTDSFGNYLDLTAGPNGVNDNGSFLATGFSGPQILGVLELRSTTPHNLQSRQIVGIFNAGTANIPWTNYGTLAFPSLVSTDVWVTGPNTIAFTYQVDSNTTFSPVWQTVNSTTEVPVQIGYYIQNPINSTTCPYELIAGCVASIPGCDLWLNLSNIGDDSYATAVAQKIAANIGPTNNVILEHGNEHWNSANPFTEYGGEQRAKELGKYMPTGKTLFGYYPCNGQSIVSSDTWYACEATHQYDVFQTAWVAAGLSASRIKRVYGSFWAGSSVTQDICSSAGLYNFPPFYGIAVAPYMGARDYCPNDNTPIAAITPAGYPGYTPGNWPCDAWNDFSRHLLFYNPFNWSNWSSHTSVLPSGVRMVCYESSMDYLIPDLVPNKAQLYEDCFYHLSYYDLIRAYELMIQQGNPLVANSGAIEQSYFNYWGDISVGGPLWKASAGPGQAPGTGTSNRFWTPQGGFTSSGSADGTYPYGYAQTNQSPNMQLILDWQKALTQAVPAAVESRAAVTIGI